MRKLAYHIWYYASIPVEEAAYRLRLNAVYGWFHRMDSKIFHWSYPLA